MKSINNGYKCDKFVHATHVNVGSLQFKFQNPIWPPNSKWPPHTSYPATFNVYFKWYAWKLPDYWWYMLNNWLILMSVSRIQIQYDLDLHKNATFIISFSLFFSNVTTNFIYIAHKGDKISTPEFIMAAKFNMATIYIEIKL